MESTFKPYVDYNLSKSIRELFGDIVVIAKDGTRCWASKIILASFSEFFNSLITEEMKELKIEFLTGVELEILLDLIYHLDIRKISESNVKSLYRACQLTNSQDIESLCLQFITKNITPKNVMEFYFHALELKDEILHDKCMAYMLEYFSSIVETCNRCLEIRYMDIVKLVTSDYLNVKSEEMLWEFLVKWIEYDIPGRYMHVVTILSTVRRGRMDRLYFMDKVMTCPLLVNNDECQKLLRGVKYYFDGLCTLENEELKNIQIPTFGMPRYPRDFIFVIGGWEDDDPMNTVEAYDYQADSWKTVPGMRLNTSRGHHSSVNIGHNIYTMGGSDGRINLNSCEVLNVVTRNSKLVSNMYERRCYLCAVVLNGSDIYAIGGYDGTSRLNTVERFDPKTNQWTQVSPMTQRRSDAAATVMSGKIFVIGGFDGRNCTNTAEVYNPLTDTWIRIPPMVHNRSGHVTIAMDKKLYVIGGFNGEQRVEPIEVYDTSKCEWSIFNHYPLAISNPGAAVIDEENFMIFGGYDGDHCTSKVNNYNFKYGIWEKLTKLNNVRCAFSTVMVHNVPNFLVYSLERNDKLTLKRAGRKAKSRLVEKHENISKEKITFNFLEYDEEHLYDHSDFAF